MTKDIFVVVLEQSPSDNYDKGWLLQNEPMTLKDALKAIRWQGEGGFVGRDYIMAKASDLAGIMEHTPEGTLRPVLITKGPYTELAYKNALLNIWGVKQ